MNIIRKIDSIKKLFVTNKITKPVDMGNKILILATAPCVQDYFDYETVRKQFQGYDLACVNYMLVYSKEEVFAWRPKYFVLLDPIFYSGSVDPLDDSFNSQKKLVCDILEEVDWECYIVTSVLADFGLKNKNIRYINLSCFEKAYSPIYSKLYKRNLINFGIYNVIQGAVFFAITFGYKNIAILGCTYKNLQMEMQEDGLHIFEHNHYYNLDREEEIVSNEKLAKIKDGFVATMYKRAVKSYKCCWDLRKYAESMNATITNYSKGSMIDAFYMGTLKKS